jgi:hypothetical protein
MAKAPVMMVEREGRWLVQLQGEDGLVWEAQLKHNNRGAAEAWAAANLGGGTYEFVTEFPKPRPPGGPQ